MTATRNLYIVLSLTVIFYEVLELQHDNTRRFCVKHSFLC